MNKIRYKYQLLFLLFMVGNLFSITNNETGWDYTQTTLQTFHILEFNIDGQPAEGDGKIGTEYDGECLNNPFSCDVIGAFMLRDENEFGDLDGDGEIESSVEVCVGWVYANNQITSPANDPNGRLLTTLGIMGVEDPGTEAYMDDGEVPFLLKIYDHQNDVVLPVDLSNIYHNEEECGLHDDFEFDFGDLGPFSNNNIFLYNEFANSYNTFGCTDDSACNIDLEATANDGSCIFPPSGELETSGDVEGNSFTFYFGDSALEGTGDFDHQVIVTQGFTEIYNQMDAESPVILDGLEWSTTYSIEVITTNFDVCESLPNADYPLSTYDNVQTSPMPTPDQVILSTLVPGEGEMYLEWNPVDYGSIYRIFSNGTLIDSVLYPINETSYLDTQLAPGLNYSYQIQAINLEYEEETSYGEISDSVSATTDFLSTVELDSLTIGQGQIQLAWSMENPQYAGENYSFDIYVNDQYLISRYGTSYTVPNLDADEEYCFYIIAGMELPVDGELVDFIANQSSTLCGTPDEISGWSILIEVENHVVTQDDGAVTFYDTYNEIGMNPEAIDGYDPELDYFEPPISPSLGAVSFSFYHPEWGFGDIFGDYFTSDIRSLKDLSKSLEKWEANTEFTTIQGNGSISFDFISNAGGHPIFLNWTDQYFLVSNGGSVPFQYNENGMDQFIEGSLNPGYSDDFNFIIGNQAPAIPLNLQAEGGSREMSLEWDLSIDCESGEVSCNDYANRYPATSYKIFRSWTENIIPQLIGLAGTRHDRISIIPSDLSTDSLFTDSLFSIIESPSDGFIQAEYFESYIDLNGNDIYDIGEEFIDCGWDGICPGEPGYETEEFTDLNEDGFYNLGEEFEDFNSNGIWDENGPDIGESDGICNIVYYYQANGYLTNGLDSLTFSNGMYDYGEDYIDDNDNNDWDEGESYTDSSKLIIRISDSLESEYHDTGLRTGAQYYYNVLASNEAGDSDFSTMDAGSTEDNLPPIADAGLDQKRYLTSINEDSVLCTFPLDNLDLDNDGYPDYDLNGNAVLDTINNSYDPDGLENEELDYFWEIHDPDNSLDFAPQDATGDGWWRIGNDAIISFTLPESDYMPEGHFKVRLLVQDVSEYYSNSPDIMTIEITRDIPVPAMVTNLTASPSLYYVDLEWEESEYDLPGGINPPPEGYDGNLDIADFYDIYRDSILYETLAADSEVMSFVDVELTPSQEYCYYVIATNEAGESIPSNENCYTTGDLPVPSITSPSGGEILISGDILDIEWTSALDEALLSESLYIDTLRVLHSVDAGETWDQIEDASWSLSQIPDNFQWEVPDVNSISFRNKFKVEVLDIGDYDGIDSVLHIDITDHLIIIANDELENTYQAGWNIISTPLLLSSSNVEDNFDVDNYAFDLFDQNGAQLSDPSDVIEFQASNGFYMVSEEDLTLSIQGEILDETYTIDLDAGWNLIGHPLVAKVVIDSLQVFDPSNPDNVYYSFEEAVDDSLLMPTIQGFSNELQMHTPVNVLEPFLGYWIHARVPLQLIASPHIYDESLYERNDKFLLTLISQEYESNQGSLLWKDMIKVGLSESASDVMVYGEDEYDIPIDIATSPSFSDIWIDRPDWYESGDAEKREFFSDIKRLDDESRKAWNLKGELRGNESEAQIYLNWEIENIELIGEDGIHLIFGQEIVDMRVNNFALIDRNYFGNMQIIVGILSCEDEGLVTCDDGTCVEALEECSCESQGLIDCGDDTCAETLEECSCESQGLIECEDGFCVENQEECGDLLNEIPDEFSISKPYPNPFNPTVKLDFSLPSITQVDINIYDINGTHIERLMHEVKSAGYYSVIWDANHLSTGMYFIQFSSAEGVETMKVLLIK